MLSFFQKNGHNSNIWVELEKESGTKWGKKIQQGFINSTWPSTDVKNQSISGRRTTYGIKICHI
jgi:hypothetical protein